MKKVTQEKSGTSQVGLILKPSKKRTERKEEEVVLSNKKTRERMW